MGRRNRNGPTSTRADLLSRRRASFPAEISSATIRVARPKESQGLTCRQRGAQDVMSEPTTGRQERQRREGQTLSSWAVPHWIYTTYVLPCPGEARRVSGSVSLVGKPEAIHMSEKSPPRTLARPVVPNPAFWAIGPAWSARVYRRHRQGDRLHSGPKNRLIGRCSIRSATG